jgi:hypothetical protein
VIEKWRKLETAFSVFVLKMPTDGLFQQPVKPSPSGRGQGEGINCFAASRN